MRIIPQRMSSRLTLLFIGAMLTLSFFLGSSAPKEAGGVAVSLSAETLFTIGSFPVSNSFIWSLFLSIVLIFGALRLHANMREVPGGLQNIAELVIESFFNFATSITGSEEKTKKMFPFVFTLFIFILFANLFTYLPGSSAVTYEGKSLFRAVISDYNTVFLMTILAVLAMQGVSIAVNGPFGYLKKYINFSSPLNFVLGLMDIIGELSKILSMSFRLFGNIFAGEVLGAVMLFLMPYFFPLPFMLMGLISAVIQALVFSLLTIIFLAMASERASQEA